MCACHFLFSSASPKAQLELSVLSLHLVAMSCAAWSSARPQVRVVVHSEPQTVARRLQRILLAHRMAASPSEDQTTTPHAQRATTPVCALVTIAALPAQCGGALECMISRPFALFDQARVWPPRRPGQTLCGGLAAGAR